MDGPHCVPSLSPHAEASASINPMNDNASTSLASGESRAEEIQVPRSPQLLSLQINGHNTETLHNHDSNTSYVESSERGSETSVDSRRPELQSASTFTDSLPSVPSSSLNDTSRSMELGNTRVSDGNSQESRPNHKPPNSQETSQISSINGTIDGPHDPVVPGNSQIGSLSPLRSPKSATSRSENGMQFAPGHKRTATGDVKSVPQNLAVSRMSDAKGAARRRSKSTGSPAHGSRIAQLSVHIRTRLSYAAAKIEKSRQLRENNSQLPLRGLETLASLSSESPSDTTSIPGSNPTSHPLHQTKRLTNDTARSDPHNRRAQFAISSPGQMFPIPKLAPPVDIISSNGETRRRQPNPNLAARSPYARHKRHHSYQEHSLARPLNGSPSVVGHGTPSIPPSHAPASSQNGGFYRPQTNSQNTSMEQDAIETLLFMSSPENSGYRPSPRHLQPAATQRSLNESIYPKNSDVFTNPSQNSQSDASYNGHMLAPENHGLGLEARAGDEIDKLLDQMGSDSEDDSLFASNRQRMNGRQILRDHPGQSR